MEDNGNSFGTLFREAREQAGRQLGDIAAELHINAAHLRALEEESFERLPSHSFARGYIRAYARALETDPEPLLKAYLRAAPPSEEWHASKPLDEEIEPSRLPLVIGTAVVVATMVALFVTWFLGSGYLDKEPTVVDAPAVTPVTAEAGAPPVSTIASPAGADEPAIDETPELSAGRVPDETEPVAKQHSPEEPEGAADDTTTASSPTTTETASLESQRKTTQHPTADPAAPDPIRAPAGDDRLEITLDGDSWVVVKDANHRQLMYGLYRKGASKTLIGEAPFQVFLGNAPAVTLKADGKPFDPSGFVRSNKTARFTVPNPTTGN